MTLEINVAKGWSPAPDNIANTAKPFFQRKENMVSSTVLTLAVIPAIYALVKQWRLKRGSVQ